MTAWAPSPRDFTLTETSNGADDEKQTEGIAFEALNSNPDGDRSDDGGPDGASRRSSSSSGAEEDPPAARDGDHEEVPLQGAPIEGLQSEGSGAQHAAERKRESAGVHRGEEMRQPLGLLRQSRSQLRAGAAVDLPRGHGGRGLEPVDEQHEESVDQDRAARQVQLRDQQRE